MAPGSTILMCFEAEGNITVMFDCQYFFKLQSCQLLYVYDIVGNGLYYIQLWEWNGGLLQSV